MLSIGIILLIVGVIVWAVGHVVPNALAARIGIGLAVIGAALILLGLLLPAVATGPTYAAAPNAMATAA